MKLRITLDVDVPEGAYEAHGAAREYFIYQYESVPECLLDDDEADTGNAAEAVEAVILDILTAELGDHNLWPIVASHVEVVS